MIERYRLLRQIARATYRVPIVRPATRMLIRFLIQRTSLSPKSKQRLYNFFAHDTAPACSIKFDCVTPEPIRVTLKLELDIRDDLSRKLYYWGFTHYERGTVRLFIELLKHKVSVFDIGANIGFYALLAAAILKERGEVHAFEPHPEVFRYLSHNADLNSLKMLRLNRAALSDLDGEMPLFLPADNAWTNASLIKGFMKQQAPISVNTFRFDSYCSRQGFRQVDLIKIDVEGAELKVFEGMGELLDAWLPDIICEVLPPYEQELEQFFRGKPYRKFLITDHGLEEMSHIKAHPCYRDFYLSCAPIVPEKF